MALTLVFSVLLTSCGTANDNPSSSSKSAQSDFSQPEQSEANHAAITVTDLAGKTYTFDKPLDKVLIQWSGSGGPFMTMSALLGKDVCKHIAGMDNGLQEYRMDMYKQFIKTVPDLKNVKIIGNMQEDDFNMEASVTSGVEAAILPLGLRQTVKDSIQPKLEAAGIPVIYIDYHSETIENHIKSTQIIGALFGKEERAKQINDFYTSHVTAVYNKAAQILKTKKRPKVYIECASKSPEDYTNSYPNDYMEGALCYNVGGYSIAADVLKGGQAGAVKAEYLLSSNPDKIIFSGSYWPSAPGSIRLGFQATEQDTRKLVSKYLDRSGWDQLKAVQNGEIYVIHHGVAREMYDCATIEALAKFIFSDEFADLDPTATLREYYETFLPYDFSGVWYMKY